MIPETEIKDFKIRSAEPEDAELLLQFIKALAEYEHMSDQVTATKELINRYIFKEKMAEVIIAEYGKKPVGFALFFHNFSTFLGKPGIYLEDLYVIPEMRGMGFGKAMLSYLERLVEERDFGRLEWTCLDWNESSIRFYTKLGAQPLDQWTVYRLQR